MIEIAILSFNPRYEINVLSTAVRVTVLYEPCIVSLGMAPRVDRSDDKGSLIQ